MYTINYLKNKLPPDGPKVIKELVLFFLVVTAVVFWSGQFWNYANKTTDNQNEETADSTAEDPDTSGDCNVTGINLHGTLVTYIPPEEMGDSGKNQSDSTASESILLAIKSAEEDENTKAIILEIDSYGGMPVAGEEVAVALKHSTKPTIAFIRGAGASAAYMAAIGAQTIFASQFSDVGGIGVTLSYLDNVVKNNKEGLTFNQLSTGKYKDMGNPDKPVTNEEKVLAMRDLNIIHNDFIKMVSENRKIDLETVKKLADGSTVLGQMALENKLVDKIGNYFDVLDFVSSTINIKPEVCWY